MIRSHVDPVQIPHYALCLLFRGGLGLSCLLLVASDHDHGQKRANDGGAEEDEDDGNADGPYARGEEAV